MKEVYFYGARETGYRLDDYKIKDSKNNLNIHIKRLNDKIDFNKADVIIIPSGVFEKIEPKFSFGSSEYEIGFNQGLISEYEKKIIDAIGNGKIVIFLLQRITKRINGSNINHTDLVKKLLVGVFPESIGCSPVSTTKSENKFFNEYVSEYGVANTLIKLDRNEFHALVKSGSNVYGFCTPSKRLFFMPFHTNNFSDEGLLNLTSLISKSVIEYVDDSGRLLPEWFSDFSFDKEVEIINEIERLESELVSNKEKLLTYDNLKKMLGSKGTGLENLVVDCLRDYFGLNVDSYDEKLDDFSILDEDSNFLISGEVKGVNGGCARSHLSQIVNNISMKKYPVNTRGILIINDNMKAQSLEEKVGSSVSNDCLKFAEINNLLILRTIDVLYLMKKMEFIEVKERKESILKILLGGPGWYRVDENTEELIGPK